MKQFIAIALFRGRGGRLCQRVLCAILALLLISTSVFAQEPELLTPEEAKAVYEELTADCMAVEADFVDNSPDADMKIVLPTPAVEIEPEPVPVTKPVTKLKPAAEPEKIPVINSESIPEPEPMHEPESVAESEPEPISVSEYAIEPESISESITEPEPELATESEPEPIFVSDSVTEPVPEQVGESEPDPEPVACDTPEPQKIVTSASSPKCSEAKPISNNTEDEEPIPYVEEDDNSDDELFGDEDEDGNILTADTVAVDEEKTESGNAKNGKIDTPSSQVIRYAKRFWDEAEEQYDKHNIDISGTKTFDFKKAKVSGDVGHFSTEHTDCYPGDKLTQSLHLEVDGNIDANSTVHAVLDDSDDEDRKFTVNIDSNGWKIVLG